MCSACQSTYTLCGSRKHQSTRVCMWKINTPRLERSSSLQQSFILRLIVHVCRYIKNPVKKSRIKGFSVLFFSCKQFYGISSHVTAVKYTKMLLAKYKCMAYKVIHWTFYCITSCTRSVSYWVIRPEQIFCKNEDLKRIFSWYSNEFVLILREFQFLTPIIQIDLCGVVDFSLEL